MQPYEESAKSKLNQKLNYKPCPYCCLILNPKNLETHIYKYHKDIDIFLKSQANVKPSIEILLNSENQTQLPVVSCPYCAVRVSQKRLKKHIKRVHIDQNYINKSETSAYADWYECNTVDSIDGSKYLGFERREYQDSRFGSFPLHDDYSEDSWAD